MKAYLLSLLLLAGCSSVQAEPPFGRAQIAFAGQQVAVQLADTPALRARGLMFQQSAEPGMLLLYSTPEPISLWMRNTGLELDVAFIDANWQIQSIKPLEPYDESIVSSDGPVIAALEKPRGWFAARGLTVGSQLSLVRD